MATVTSLDLNGSGAGLNASRSYQENAAAILLAPSATLSASGNFNGQMLRLSGLLTEAQIGIASGVSLSGTSLRVGSVTVGSVTGGRDGADLVIAFNSNATASRVQTVLRNLTYLDVSDAPVVNQLITFDLAGTVRTDTITVTALNDRPLLDLNGAATGTGSTATFIENRSVLVAPSGTLADPDTSALTSLTATLLARPDGNATERLSLDAAAASAAAAAGLSVTYAAATGALSLVGSASHATYQVILRGIVYENGSDQPSTAARTVRVVASDGAEASPTRDAIVAITRVNDAPTLDLNGGAAGTGIGLSYRTGDAPVKIAPAGLVGDIDSANLGGGSLRIAFGENASTADQLRIVTDSIVTLADGGSTVRVGGTNIGTVSGGTNGADLVVGLNTSATPANVQTLLQHIGYMSSVGSSTLPRQLTFSLDDGDGTANGGQAVGSASATIQLTTGPGNVAPILSGDLHANITDGGTYQFNTGDFFYTDPDDGPDGITFEVDDINNGDVLLNGSRVFTFTAAQLAAGQLSFRHDGSESVGGFTIFVEDGNEDGSIPAVRDFVFTVGAPASNTPPTLTGDLQATIANAGTYQFTTSDFFYTDVDDVASGVSFEARTINNGHVLVNGAVNARFTAQQLAAGQVSFRHDGSEPVAGFAIVVEDGNEDGSAPVPQDFVFTVTTAPGNAPPTLTGDLRASVANGGTYVLTPTDLFYSDVDDAASGIAFAVTAVAGGTVLVGGSPASSFSPQQLSAGQVAFRHDGASPAPSLSVSVEDGNEDGSAPVARDFLFTVESGGGAALDLSGAARGVTANLGAGQWSLATKVMALGDSITNGDAPEGQDEHGYRGFFYLNMIRDGRLIDLVGPNSNGLVPDPQHAGYPGETGDDIQALLPSLLATYAPQIILLMAGTNDIFQKSNPENAVRAEIAGMLDFVASASPSTHVYVSTLLPLQGHETAVANVNAAIRGVVADAVGRGQNVSLVEMPSVGLSDLFDGIHPNDTGYRKMADHWTSAVLADPPLSGPATAIDPAVDAVTGSPYNDLLIGDGRANRLTGGAGVDWIRGEGGNDGLFGGAGRDTLVGGAGADTLTGGPDPDTFVFAPGFDQDTITDFIRGEDVIDLRAFALNVGDFASWRQAHISVSGANAVVTVEPGQTLTLTGISAATLQASDFLFL